MSKGYAFIQYNSREAALQALETMDQKVMVLPFHLFTVQDLPFIDFGVALLYKVGVNCTLVSKNLYISFSFVSVYRRKNHTCTNRKT